MSNEKMKGRAGRRLTAALALTALILAAVPQLAGATASGVRVFNYDAGPDGDIYRTIELRATPGDGTVHRVWAEPTGDGAYVLRDSEGIYLAPPQSGDQQAEKCSTLSTTAVRCAPPDAAQGYTDVTMSINMSAGNDVVDLRSLEPQIATEILGGGGNDRLLGSPGADWIYAGKGRDVLIGYAGRDSMYGHRGPDVIRARDGEGDDISCGPGRNSREKAIRDRLDRGYKDYYGPDEFVRLPISC